MDIWKHGKYFDTWSIVHLLSGMLGAAFLFKWELSVELIFMVAAVAAVVWEYIEKMLRIDENVENALTDILLALLGVWFVYLRQDIFVSHEAVYIMAAVAGGLSLWGFIDYKRRGYR